MQNSAIIFESYNSVVAGSYNKVFMNIKTEDILKIKEENVFKHLDADINKWANMPIKELHGITPEEYFKSISDFGELVELFKLGSKLCDKDLPKPLVEKLRPYGSLAEETLLGLAADKDLKHSEEDFYIALMAIQVLGQWKTEKAVNIFVDMLLDCDENEELFIEELVGALVSIGQLSIEPLVQVVEKAEYISFIQEYIMDALVKAGRTRKSDRIYRCLKNAFLKMENKVFGAICIGDYGDGRGITVLRGYAEKNKSNINRETFYEIKSAVHRLGGNMDDIKFNG